MLQIICFDSLSIIDNYASINYNDSLSSYELVQKSLIRINSEISNFLLEGEIDDSFEFVEFKTKDFNMLNGIAHLSGHFKPFIGEGSLNIINENYRLSNNIISGTYDCDLVKYELSECNIESSALINEDTVINSVSGLINIYLLYF